MAIPDGFVYEDPSIMIDAFEYKCGTRGASLTPEDKTVDISTWCNPGGERPASTKWTLDIEVVLSYGTPDGTWNKLNALRKLKKTVILKPASTAALPANPSATFDIYVPSIPFMDGKIGAAGVFMLTAVAVGEPVFATA